MQPAAGPTRIGERSAQVVEPECAAPLRSAGGADTEQAEVVVVARSGQAQKGGVGTGFTRNDFQAEQVGVEAQRPVEVGDEQHGVVETNG